MTERPIDSITIGKRHRRETRESRLAGREHRRAWACCTRSSSSPTASSLPASGGCARARRSAGKRFRCGSSIWKTSPAASLRRTSSESRSCRARSRQFGARWSRSRRRRRRERMSQGGKVGKLSLPSEAGKTADKIGAFAGVSRAHRGEDRAVVAAARGRAGKISASGRGHGSHRLVNGPYKRLKVAMQAEKLRAEPPPFPGNGPYRVIAADPPWPYEVRQEDPSHRATHPYPQMSIEQICALPVASMAHADSVLWFWTTNHHVRAGVGRCVDAWGFRAANASSRGPRIAWARATGCAGKPSIA